ncbi:hypothetical protein D3C71_2127720 [compost metagenome]
MIRILIEDNGFKPVDYQRINLILQEAIPNAGYGIRNVEKRIKLHFGEPYGLHFGPGPSGGTRVTMIIPTKGGEISPNQET